MNNKELNSNDYLANNREILKKEKIIDEYGGWFFGY